MYPYPQIETYRWQALCLTTMMLKRTMEMEHSIWQSAIFIGDLLRLFFVNCALEEEETKNLVTSWKKASVGALRKEQTSIQSWSSSSEVNVARGPLVYYFCINVFTIKVLIMSRREIAVGNRGCFYEAFFEQNQNSWRTDPGYLPPTWKA